MSGFLHLVFCVFLFVGALALFGLLLWFVLGRGRRGEDRMIGALDKQATLKATTGNGGPRMK